MEVNLYISENKFSNTFIKRPLINNNNLEEEDNIIISELNMVYFEILSQKEIDISNAKFILGGTILNIEFTGYNNRDKYTYGIDQNDIDKILISSDENKSKNHIRINEQNVRFSQLFLNELGYVQPILRVSEDNYTLKNINIKSPKINDLNFEIIIKYLMFNNYFDNDILYKNNLKTDYSNFENSLLESLKYLHEKVEHIFDNLHFFKVMPVKKHHSNYKIAPYSSTSNIDDVSFSWLINNLDEINTISYNAGNTLKIKSKHCSINNILQVNNEVNFNSYENKIIFGYTSLYLFRLQELLVNFKKNKLRTRLSNFSEYLTIRFNEYLTFYIEEIIDYFFKIRNYFEAVLLVEEELKETPTSIVNFISLPHYKNCYELILLYNDFFSNDLVQNSKKSLEIESFDKLFESYILYLLRDTLSLNFNLASKIKFESNSEDNFSNKLSGTYTISTENSINIKIYYESLPSEFIQFSNSRAPYNPDYVIEFSKDNYKEFIILDAKYKKYRNYYFKSDIEKLTLKYLHKIGVSHSKHKVVGLYILSINEINKFNGIFKNEFDILKSENPTIPSIGGVEIYPNDFDIKNNLLFDLINKHYLFFIKNLEASNRIRQN